MKRLTDDEINAGIEYYLNTDAIEIETHPFLYVMICCVKFPDFGRHILKAVKSREGSTRPQHILFDALRRLSNEEDFEYLGIDMIHFLGAGIDKKHRECGDGFENSRICDLLAQSADLKKALKFSDSIFFGVDEMHTKWAHYKPLAGDVFYGKWVANT